MSAGINKLYTQEASVRLTVVMTITYQIRNLFIWWRGVGGCY